MNCHFLYTVDTEFHVDFLCLQHLSNDSDAIKLNHSDEIIDVSLSAHLTVPWSHLGEYCCLSQGHS